MGLHLLMTTMVLGIFIMAMREHQTQRRASAGAMVGGFALLLVLAVVANFVRILALILFRILPTDPMHHVLGLLSLGVYALLPFYVAWRWWTARYAASSPTIAQLGHPVGPTQWPYLTLGLVLLALAAVGWQFRQPAPIAPVDLSTVETQGYQTRVTDMGVYQLSKTDALVYIKPPVRAFQGGHDPRICWQGSGYTFTHIHTRTVAGHTIYQATLELADDRLHTAWWYDNGTLKTINEWQWRRATLLGDAPFRLVNVTTDDPARLEELVREWLVR
jgi:exosortase N